MTVQQLPDAARHPYPALRMERHSANALQLAEWLEQQPEVERVWFPAGLAPHHQLARQQMALPGGMISVVVKGDEGYAERIISKLRWFTLAESPGGVESLVSQPFQHDPCLDPAGETLANGITPQLIRLSVGIEDPHDLIADWQQALREGLFRRAVVVSVGHSLLKVGDKLRQLRQADDPGARADARSRLGSTPQHAHSRRWPAHRPAAPPAASAARPGDRRLAQRVAIVAAQNRIAFPAHSSLPGSRHRCGRSRPGTDR